MSFSKPGALSSFNSTNYLIICSSTVVKNFNVLISTSPGSFLWKMNTCCREVSFWFLHEKNLTMQQRIPGSSTSLVSHPFPHGFLHHHFCFCHLCLRCLQSCLGWAFSGFHKSFPPTTSANNKVHIFLYEKRLLPHLPWTLNALELPSHQYNLFELGVCSCLGYLDCKTLHMISSDPELLCWLSALAVRAPVSRHLQVLQVSCSKIFPYPKPTAVDMDVWQNIFPWSTACLQPPSM